MGSVRVGLSAMILLVGLLSSVNVFASTPETMVYQGSLNHSDGTAFDGEVEAEFRIYNAQSGGSEVWGEPARSIDVINGHLTARLGASSSLDGVFDGEPYWLEITLDGETLSPRTPIESIPYAFYAGRASDAERVGGKTADELQSYDNSGSGLGATDMQSAVDELQERIAQLEMITEAQYDANNELIAQLEAITEAQYDDINDLKALTQDISRSTVDGHPAVVFKGVNVHVQNGAGETATENGTGNLIVGYNEERSGYSMERGGSHNIVVGTEHEYTSHGGLVVGKRNRISGEYSSVSGGYKNNASAQQASISGGTENNAKGQNSSICGGMSNTATGGGASVSGGISNRALGHFSSVSGGNTRDANGQSEWRAGQYTSAN